MAEFGVIVHGVVYIVVIFHVKLVFELVVVIVRVFVRFVRVAIRRRRFDVDIFLFGRSFLFVSFKNSVEMALSVCLSSNLPHAPWICAE